MTDSNKRPNVFDHNNEGSRWNFGNDARSYCPSSGIRNLPRKVLKTYNPNCDWSRRHVFALERHGERSYLGDNSPNVGLGELARRYWADRRLLSMYFDCLLFGQQLDFCPVWNEVLSNNNGNVNSSKSSSDGTPMQSRTAFQCMKSICPTGRR